MEYLQIGLIKNMNKYIIGSLLISTLFSQSMIPGNIDLDLIREQLKSQESIESEESLEETDFNQEAVLIEQTSDIEEDVVSYYGYEYFERDINFFDNIPTPSNFKLGSGDEVILSLWGEKNSREKFVINKEGLIYYKNVGFINISNKTIDEAEAILVNKLSNIYSTLKGDNKSTDLMLELGKLRSLNIYFSGEIKNPGINLIHPFSDIFSAIVQAGGIREEGSLRNIKIIREGDIIQSVDFYNFFVTGQDNFSNIKLVDGDVIHIPAVASRVQIVGEVSREGLYETIDGDFLDDIINYAAGLTSMASSNIIIDTVIPMERRKANDRAISSINLSFKDFNSTSLNNGDLITIPAIAEVSSKVEIFGRVKNPGFYPANGATLRDILDIAGGFDDPTYRKTIKEDNIVILRNDESQFYSIELLSSYKDSDKFKLEINDKIFIYEDINYRNSFVYSVEGEINQPGTYPLGAQGVTVGQAIEKAGGLTVLGSDKNVTISQEFSALNEDGDISIAFEQINNVNTDFKIGINSVIKILPVENVVRVEGTVYNPGLITYTEGYRYPRYIELAGGYKPNHLKKKAYIKRANGNIEKVKGPLISKGKKIYPGDTIIVPEDENPTEFNVSGFTADILSVLSNLAAILFIVDNNTN
jgi:protein involved in polysaccharide export with SLBB domain